jgi:CubicO group peptidase (beta-lactamase class C family)
MKIKTAVAAVIAGGFVPCGLTAAAELDDPGAIDRYLSGEIAERQIPGAVAMVVDEDETLYLKSFGQRDVANQIPMTNDTIFRIASMTKPIATTAIMMLVEEGKLSLDDPISKYVPDYVEIGVIQHFDPTDGSFTTRPPSGPVTIRQMLSHSSGLAYGFASDTVAALNANGVNGIDVPLLYDPGTAWSYSHGISVVGRVLEEIEGVGLDEFFDQRLFGPLGMNDTSFAVPASKNGRVTTTHRRDDSGAFIETPNPNDIRSGVSGDGGLNSTASDYARFIQLILNDGVAPNGERLISRASVAEQSAFRCRTNRVRRWRGHSRSEQAAMDSASDSRLPANTATAMRALPAA